MSDALRSRLRTLQDALFDIMGRELRGQVPISAAQDDVDAVAAGINVLLQELHVQVDENRELRDRLALIFDHVGEAILVVDAHEVIEHANAAAARLLGTDPTTLVGSSLCRWVTSPERDAADGASPARAEWRLRTASGDSLPALAATALLPGSGPRGRVVVLQDLRQLRELVAVAESERSRADELAVAHAGLERALEELRATQLQLAHAQKMEALGRLAGGIAHDFNNVLLVILSSAHVISTALRASEIHQAVAELKSVEEACDRARRLTTQLLTFARKQPREEVRADVHAALAQLDRIVGRLLGADVTWIPEFATDLGGVDLDPIRLEQILMNLVGNARDAMPRGGTLRVVARRETVDGAHDRLRPGQWIRIEVHDTGAGIPKDLQVRVFEPFFTTKDPDRGTGLGLAICYATIAEAGGAIVLDSVPGQGTTVTFWLPSVPLPVAHEAPGIAAGAPASPRTILLAEDEPAVRRLLVRALEGAGFIVLSAADGVEALALAQQHAGAFDALVTDLVMPRMGGAELAAAIQHGHPSLPIVFMSGYTDREIPSLEAARATFLAKPFTPPDLALHLRRVLAH